MFKDEGLVISVGTVGGLERFDGNTSATHTHFVCTRCSAVLDLMDINLEDGFCRVSTILRAAKSQTTDSASTVCARNVCRQQALLNK